MYGETVQTVHHQVADIPTLRISNAKRTQTAALIEKNLTYCPYILEKQTDVFFSFDQVQGCTGWIPNSMPHAPGYSLLIV